MSAARATELITRGKPPSEEYFMVNALNEKPNAEDLPTSGTVGVIVAVKRPANKRLSFGRKDADRMTDPKGLLVIELQLCTAQRQPIGGELSSLSRKDDPKRNTRNPSLGRSHCFFDGVRL